MLEWVELRSLGWESNVSIESFYRDKFEEVEERRERLEDNDASTPAEEESSTTPDDETVQEIIDR